jgi:hypothetical protein
MNKPLEIQPHKQAMLTGSVLTLSPFWVLELGSVARALVFQQLLFRAKGFKNSDGENGAVRFSYTKLQAQVPFYTRRWVIEIIKELRDINAIEVTRTKRVNIITLNGEKEYSVEATLQNSAKMLIFPVLASKIGLLETIVLQQIHIRHYNSDGSMWVIRSFAQWQSDVFMFLGMATVKRTFARLKAKGLIYVKPYNGEDATVNSYRVNYLRVAEVLNIDPPEIIKPKKIGAGAWKNPLYPNGNAPFLSASSLPVSPIH